MLGQYIKLTFSTGLFDSYTVYQLMQTSELKNAINLELERIYLMALHSGI